MDDKWLFDVGIGACISLLIVFAVVVLVAAVSELFGPFKHWPWNRPTTGIDPAEYQRVYILAQTNYDVATQHVITINDLTARLAAADSNISTLANGLSRTERLADFRRIKLEKIAAVLEDKP